jgi:small subunit ribosomal protein S20
MPLTESAIKRSRQNKQRQKRLQPFKTNMKTMLKKIADAAKAGNKDEVKALMPQVQKAIDMAAKKGIIHRKNADNKKSSVAKLAAK